MSLSPGKISFVASNVELIVDDPFVKVARVPEISVATPDSSELEALASYGMGSVMKEALFRVSVSE